MSRRLMMVDSQEWKTYNQHSCSQPRSGMITHHPKELESATNIEDMFIIIHVSTVGQSVSFHFCSNQKKIEQHII